MDWFHISVILQSEFFLLILQGCHKKVITGYTLRQTFCDLHTHLHLCYQIYDTLHLYNYIAIFNTFFLSFGVSYAYFEHPVQKLFPLKLDEINILLKNYIPLKNS